MRAALMLLLACACACTCASALAACGPKHHPPPTPSPIDAASEHAPIDAPISAEPGPLTRDECVALIDHELEVGMADQRARKPSDLVPTADQVAALRAKLVAEQVDPCL